MSPAPANPFVPYTCRVCQARKGESNHWFALVILEGMQRALGIHEWKLGIAQCESAAVACGEPCVHVLVSRWLETRGFDPPAVRSETAAAPASPQQQLDLNPPALPSSADLDAADHERRLAEQTSFVSSVAEKGESPS